MWGKGHEFAGDPHKTQHISAPHISQKSKIIDSFSVLWCDCHWQSMDFDSLRGAPPQGEAFGRSRATAPAGAYIAQPGIARLLARSSAINEHLSIDWDAKDLCVTF